MLDELIASAQWQLQYLVYHRPLLPAWLDPPPVSAKVVPVDQMWSYKLARRLEIEREIRGAQIQHMAGVRAYCEQPLSAIDLPPRLPHSFTPPETSIW